MYIRKMCFSLDVLTIINSYACCYYSD